jgi:transcriptional regulator GlxA family with amidase domain
MELGLVHQIFATARGERGEALYEVVTSAPAPGEIRTDADFCISVTSGPEALDSADTVILPASHEDDETQVRGSLGAAVSRALGRMRPGTRIASICTGSFVLAAAGMLDNRPATTHWKSAEKFRQAFPQVRLDPDVLYTDDGDILTSAGEASGIDLCLHMIRCDHGARTANEVARATVVPPHRHGGQAQFVQRPVPDPQRSSTSRARAWALEHLAQPIALSELAAQEAMSVRTFTRYFRQETGLSPQRWLTQQRLDRAQQLLEETHWSIDQVAHRAGFGTAASLRQHLHAALGVSPSTYRSTFRG